jgi:NTE family protein
MTSAANQPEDASTFARITPEVIGTRSGELLAPCRDHHRAPVPPEPASGSAIALALSGGGFRATLAAIGVVRFLADAGLLSRVRFISSVSGGSIANGILARHYETLAKEGFSPEAFKRTIQDPTIEQVSRRSMSRAMVAQAWRAIGPRTRTNVLADTLDRWFFGGMLLDKMPGPCRYIFNAANLTTAARFGFEREFIGDYVIGTVPTVNLGLRLADAVAASAAVPGLLAPYKPPGQFPCHSELTPKLVDGGAYENTATEPVDRLGETTLIAVNAGGIFRLGPIGRLPIISVLQRSESLLYRQSTALRARELVNRFRLWEQAERSGSSSRPIEACRGVLFGLSTILSDPPATWVAQNRDLGPEETNRLARLPTSLSRFAPEDCRRLIYRTWWLTGATLAKYHPELLDAGIPSWADPPWLD